MSGRNHPEQHCTGKDAAGETSDTEPATAPATLPPAAQRALAEAEARREVIASSPFAAESAEYGGPEGPEPTRYGDWEKGGMTSDF